MKFFNYSNLLNILIILSTIYIIICQSDNFELLKYKEKKTFELTKKENFITLYMEVDEILSKKIYFYLYQTDPTKIDFTYKFIKEGEPTDFQYLDKYSVTNHGSDHTIYYKVDKPKDNGLKLYIKIIASNSNPGQKLTIESTESIIEINLIMGLVLGIIIILFLVLIVVMVLMIYKVKRDKSITETTEDVIIEKVGPEDFAPLR